MLNRSGLFSPLFAPLMTKGVMGGLVVGGGVAPITAAALDAPVSSDLMSASLPVLAFGFDRMVDGFALPTVRLRRLSDNVEQNFGATPATGIFELAAVDAWRAGADVDVVYFVDQIGGTKQLATVAGMTVAFIRSGVVQRFGTTMSGADAQLTRSANLGGVGANLAAVGALQLLNSGINVSVAGCEMHLLWSPNNRKKGTLDSTDPITGGTTTRENILCFGVNNTNQFFHYIAGGTTSDLVRIQGGGTQTQPTGINLINHRWKAKSQWVTGYLLGNAAYSEYSAGRVTKTASTYAAAVATAVQGGSLDNGSLIIGGVFSGSTTAVAATNRGDILFGGIVVTKPLTAAQRWMLHAKLSAVGQQHRIKSKADIEAYFDDYLLMRDATAGGRVVGKKGQLTVDFDVSGTQIVGQSTPNEGLIGIKNPSATTLGNSYQATTNFFASATTGTVVRLSLQDDGGATPNGALQWDVAMSAGDPKIDTRTEWSFGLGYNHATCCMTTVVAGSYDVNDRIGGRKTAAGADFGVALYEAQSGGGGNQEHGKYNINTVNRSFVHNETFGGYTWSDATWAQTDPTKPITLDAPVIPNCPDDISYGWRVNHLALHIGTFEAPAGYNPADALAVNEPKFLTAKGRSWVSGGGIQPMGHLDGSFARNDNAPVKHSASNHRIQSVPWQYQFQGTRVLWAFKAGEAFSAEKIEEVQVNLYKLVS